MYPNCPICYKNKNVISTYHGVSGEQGMDSNGNIHGKNSAKYKCKKCYCTFIVDIAYHTEIPTLKELRKEKLEKINELNILVYSNYLHK